MSVSGAAEAVQPNERLNNIIDGIYNYIQELDDQFVSQPGMVTPVANVLQVLRPQLNDLEQLRNQLRRQGGQITQLLGMVQQRSDEQRRRETLEAQLSQRAQARWERRARQEADQEDQEDQESAESAEDAQLSLTFL